MPDGARSALVRQCRALALTRPRGCPRVDLGPHVTRALRRLVSAALAASLFAASGSAADPSAQVVVDVDSALRRRLAQATARG